MSSGCICLPSLSHQFPPLLFLQKRQLYVKGIGRGTTGATEGSKVCRYDRWNLDHYTISSRTTSNFCQLPLSSLKLSLTVKVTHTIPSIYIYWTLRILFYERGAPILVKMTQILFNFVFWTKFKGRRAGGDGFYFPKSVGAKMQIWNWSFLNTRNAVLLISCLIPLFWGEEWILNIIWQAESSDPTVTYWNLEVDQVREYSGKILSLHPRGPFIIKLWNVDKKLYIDRTRCFPKVPSV